MDEARQRLFEVLGKSGCYLFCIIHLAELFCARRFDTILVFLDALKKKWIGEDCYVYEPTRILSALTGVEWTMTKEGKDYVPSFQELEAQRWERIEEETGINKIVGHFILPGWDPYGDSKTVRDGVLVSKRIFRRVA